MNNEQFSTPLFDAVKTYVDNETVSFHVPGHKKGKGMAKRFTDFVGSNVLAMDVTCFKSVDNFHNPKSVIKEAQVLAAKAYGADRSYFCVHGTSGAIQAMIMSVVSFGDKIIVPRNIHKSISAGIVISGSTPVYMQPEIDHNIGVALNVTPEMVKETLENNPDARAVLIINPTYYGVTTDIKSIVEIVHSYDIPLIVDEAHGPHLKFHSDLPISSMEAGADMCAQSTHKIIGAMTQASILHAKEGRVDLNRVKTVLNLLHTTSPSYVLLSSLDVARMQMATEGEALLDRTIKLANDARARINEINGLFCFGKEVLELDGAYNMDPTKLTINCQGLNLSGQRLENILANDYHIQVELSDFYNILAVVTIGDDELSLGKLIEALEMISNTYKEVEILDEDCVIPNIPPRVLLPRDAFLSKTKVIKFDESEGSICAEMIMAYPPGIPVIYQGELITKEIVKYVNQLKRSGLDVQGTQDPEVDYVRVIDPVATYTDRFIN